MYFYRTGQDVLPNGDSVESLVNSAILKLHTGERDWDPDEKPKPIDTPEDYSEKFGLPLGRIGGQSHARR